MDFNYFLNDSVVWDKFKRIVIDHQFHSNELIVVLIFVEDDLDAIFGIVIIVSCEWWKPVFFCPNVTKLIVPLALSVGGVKLTMWGLTVFQFSSNQHEVFLV